MRLAVISLLVMFLAVSPASTNPHEDWVNGSIAYAIGNYKQAAKWYRQAAEQGIADAQYSLGGMYYNGEGVAQDYKQAIKWYSQAAEQGYVRAQNNLGVMYYNGDGVAQDYKQAIQLFRQDG